MLILGITALELDLSYILYPNKFWVSLIAQLENNPPAMQETLFWFLCRQICWRRDRLSLQFSWASFVSQLLKNLPIMWETWVQFLGQEDPWRRERLPTPVFCPGEFDGLVHGVTKSWTGLSDFHFPEIKNMNDSNYW